MDRIVRMMFLACTALVVLGCGRMIDADTPEGYVRHCIRLMDKQALYADGDSWKSMKKQTLEHAKNITTIPEARSLVEEALKVSGGKHSRLVEPHPVLDDDLFEELMPEVSLREDGIIVLKLPAHSNSNDSLYTFTVFDFLQAHQDARGVVIDLRDNTGGNMYPMIAAVSPLIPDGFFISFKGRKFNQPVSLDYVEQMAGITAKKKFKLPDTLSIALLTNELTGSSGEATLLAFRGLKNTRTFGSPTAGFASANTPILLNDDYMMVLTIGQDVARTGEVFCDDPIAPDVMTDSPLEEGISWILGN